jgi:putative heme-binding domain-containing protein
MRCLLSLRVLLLLALPQLVSGETITPQVRLDYEQHALTVRGDAKKGRELFLDEKRTRCGVCHVVDGKGGKVGPDISQIGGKFDRPHLIESLLEPSRQMVEGYRSSTVLTSTGQVIVGIIKDEKENSFAIEDASGKRTEFNRRDVDETRINDLSLMPADLAATLSKDEFTDLVAYMETLRSGAKEKMGAGVRGPINVPDGFRISTVATGLSGATALEILDDGRILICEQSGTLRVVKDGSLLPEPMLSVDVEMNWERGLIGVTVHPEFPHQPWVYVCYVIDKPYTHHRISRFKVDGDTVIAGSEQILLRGDDQSKLGGKVPAGHQGGALHFGADGKLYVGIGEQTAGMPAQKLDTFQGKLLRINEDGTIPSDNPLLEKTSGKYQAIWAYGCRNPFTFAIHPSSGELLINDVGGKFEEINRGVAGANYGWPTVEHGFSDKEGFVGPIHVYPQSSINGSDFAPSTIGDPYTGKYFFADFVHGWIKMIDLKKPRKSLEFASGLRRPVDLRFAADGSLYVLLRNAWVVDGKFEAGTGSLLKIYRSTVQ